MKSHFIPQLTLLLALFLGIGLNSASAAPSFYSKSYPSHRSGHRSESETPILSRRMKREILHYINEEREKRNLEPLEYSGELNEVAQEWAEHMARKEKMAHRKTLLPYLKKYNWRKMNENLFYSESEWFPADFVVESWMKSPPHRRNLLMNDISRGGIGIAQARNGDYYICFNGGDPRPPLRTRHRRQRVEMEH